MSAAAAWPTKTAHPAGAAGAAALVLGIVCAVHAAVTLALGGAAWNLPAHACMGLALWLAALRLRREWRRPAHAIHLDSDGGFRLTGVPGRLALERAWQGPGWVTLRLRPQGGSGPAIERVIWKSAIPAPLWSDLALRIQAGEPEGNRHQNKDNP